jgi:hypothetical protein
LKNPGASGLGLSKQYAPSAKIIPRTVPVPMLSFVIKLLFGFGIGLEGVEV